jgi:hypothetical protein
MNHCQEEKRVVEQKIDAVLKSGYGEVHVMIKAHKIARVREMIDINLN